MLASELSESAKRRAYAMYCEAMDDDLNCDDILDIDDWEAQSDFDDLEYDENGYVYAFS